MPIKRLFAGLIVVLCLTSIKTFAETPKGLPATPASIRTERQKAEDTEELLKAIRAFDITKVSSLVNSGIDVNLKGKHVTPLIAAASLPVSEGDLQSQLKIIELLLKHGASIEHNGSHSVVVSSAMAGNTKVLEFFLNKGAKLEAPDENGNAPLIAVSGVVKKPDDALMPSIENCIKLMIERGAKVNVASGKGTTPLMAAAKAGHVGIMQILIQSGADINFRSSNGTTALLSAIVQMQENAIAFLLKSGADVHAKNSKGNTALDIVAALDPTDRGRLKNGHPDRIGALLLAAGANPNTQNDKGVTPLANAATRGYSELAKLLIEKGADVKALNTGKYPVLLVVARSGDTKLAKTLIDKGLDVKATSESGSEDSLINAISEGELEMVKLLVSQGADIGPDGQRDDKYLHWAALNGINEVLQYFLDTGSSLTLSNGNPLLSSAVYLHDQAATAWMLLDRGAEINAQQPIDGRTPLMIAAGNGNVNSVHALLQRGADINIRDKENKTALDHVRDRARFNDYRQKAYSEITRMLDGSLPVTKVAISSQSKAPAYIPYGAIKKAETGLPAERTRVARAFYYGLDDFPQSYQEAYYWFSICDYELQDDTEDMRQNFERRVFEMEDRAMFGEEATEIKVMSKLLVDPKAKETCQVFLNTLSKKLNDAEKREIEPRIQAWINAHPRAQTNDNLTPQQQKTLYLTGRLGRAINERVYDIEGIKAIIGDGADIQTSSVPLKLAIKAKRTDIVRLLIEAGSNTSNLTPQEQAFLSGISDVLEKGNIEKKESQTTYVEAVDHPSNVRTANTIRVLKYGTSEERSKEIERVKENAASYNPSGLQALSEALFAKYKDDEAIFWHFAADLRKKQSEALCPRKGERTYDYGIEPRMIKYYKNMAPEKISKAISEIIAWDAKTPLSFNLQAGPKGSVCIPLEQQDSERKRQAKIFIDEYALEKVRKTGMRKQVEYRVDDILPFAEKGVAKAQLALYICYASQSQCKMANDDIQKIYDIRAEQESAQQHKGTKHFAGIDQRKEYKKKALYWLEKSVAQKHPPALEVMARLYMTGQHSVEKNHAEACQIMLELQTANSDLAFKLAASAPWNPERDSQGEREVWQAVSLAAAQPSQSFNWDKLNLKSEDLERAKARYMKYVADHIAAKKPLCSVTDL